MMREYDVTECSEECGACQVEEIEAREGEPWRGWVFEKFAVCMIHPTTRILLNLAGRPNGWHCPACGTRVGIDERGPWREHMVPASEADRLKRGLCAMALRVVEEGSRAAQDYTGEPILTGSDAAEPAAEIMREVMAKIDAGPQEDGGLLGVPDAVPMVPKSQCVDMEFLAAFDAAWPHEWWTGHSEAGVEVYAYVWDGDTPDRFTSETLRGAMEGLMEFAPKAAEEAGKDD